MSRPVARLFDADSYSRLGCCVFYPRNIDRVSSYRFISGGRPISRVGDVLSPVPGTWVCSGSGFCLLPRVVTPISPTRVIAGGRPIARLGDSTSIRSNRRIIGSFSKTVVP